MKDSLYFLISVIIFLAVFSNCGFSAGGDLGQGDGTTETPYLIEDFSDFQSFCGDANYWSEDVCTKLMCDLDLDPNLPGREIYSFAPISGDTDIYHRFAGVAYSGNFDGNGHVISNLMVNGVYHCGLFGQVSSTGLIINLGLESISIIGSKDYIGGLVGENNGDIENSYSSGSVCGSFYVGGVVGHNGSGGSVKNSNSSCLVTGEWDVGGLGGTNESSSFFIDCYSTGDVEGGYAVGGLVGKNWYSGNITDCYSTGCVKGTNDYVGGLVGHNTHAGNISNCYSIGAAEGNAYVGGLVGSIYNGAKLMNCYSTGCAKGLDRIGGLVGDIYYEGRIENCYSTGLVEGNSYVGGLVGKKYYSAVINSFWNIETSGTSGSAGGSGKSTIDMQTESTYTSAGWSFVDRWGICEASSYPRLLWQVPAGDVVCPYGVDLIDYVEFACGWQSEDGQANFDLRFDIVADGVIDFEDMAVFANNWLASK